MKRRCEQTGQACYPKDLPCDCFPKLPPDPPYEGPEPEPDYADAAEADAAADREAGW